MPFVIVKGSDNENNSIQHKSSNSVTEKKKTSVDVKFIHHTNYNYDSYNPRRHSSSDTFGEAIASLTLQSEKDMPVNSTHSVGDMNVENNHQSREDLFVPVKGASRDMRDVLDLKVSIKFIYQI